MKTMKDAIDRKNEREKIARSIVKRRNVMYISREELERRQQLEAEEARKRQQSEEEREKADNILKRLQEEAAADNRRRQEEVEEIKRQQLEQDLFHTAHEDYGKRPMDGVTQERVEYILNDTEREIEEIIRNNGKAGTDKTFSETP